VNTDNSRAAVLAAATPPPLLTLSPATRPHHERQRALAPRLEKAKAKPNLASPAFGKRSKKPKHKNRALLSGATVQTLPSRPRHRNATGNKARERRVWPRAEKTGFASSIVFMSFPAHLGASGHHVIAMLVGTTRSSAQGKKIIFWKIKRRLSLARLLEIKTPRRSALVGENRTDVRDGVDNSQKRPDPR